MSAAASHAPRVAPVAGDAGLAACRASIAHHSKSFALASRLLPGATADRAAVVYAWCRRADDAIDRAPRAAQPAALQRLHGDLDSVYAGAATGDATGDVELDAFAAVVAACDIPRHYPEELLRGMQMDCERTVYRDQDELLRYCHRVAGVVGLMMCHVMGVSDPAARRQAAHLGIAMQLTNICRDVLEDWQLGRLYLPADLLADCGAGGLARHLGAPFPTEHTAAVAAAVRRTLDQADAFYRSGDRGTAALSWRCALAIRAARRIYAAIGQRVRRQGCDVTRGRAWVPLRGKLLQVLAALAAAVGELPRRALRPWHPAPLADQRVVRFPTDVLPLDPS